MNNEILSIENINDFKLLTDQVFADYKERFSGLIITDPASYDATKKARTEMVTLRTSLKKAADAAKKPLNQQVKKINAELNRLTDCVLEIEAPLQKTVKDYEDKKAAEKAEAERIEKERVSKIQGAISNIRDLPNTCRFDTAEQIQAKINQLANAELTEARYCEFLAEAMIEREDSINVLQKLFAEVKAAEDEKERVRAEAEALAEQRAEIEKQRAELEQLKREAEAMKAEAAEADRANQAIDDTPRSYQEKTNVVSMPENKKAAKNSDLSLIEDYLNGFLKLIEINQIDFKDLESYKLKDSIDFEISDLIDELKARIFNEQRTEIKI